jgi:hypothetical protein
MQYTLNKLTVDEFKILIRETVYDAMEDYIEDITALSSDEYKESIKTARQNYKDGQIINLEDFFNV